MGGRCCELKCVFTGEDELHRFIMRLGLIQRSENNDANEGA
jgi:hypothetical protein